MLSTCETLQRSGASLSSAPQGLTTTINHQKRAVLIDHLLAQEKMEGLEGIAPTTQVAAPQQAEEDQATAHIRCSKCG